MEVQPDDQLPAQHFVKKCSIRQIPWVEETEGQQETIEQEEQVQATGKDEPSPLSPEWWGSEDDEVQITECSIKGLEVLESYLEQHPGVCTLDSTNEVSIPDAHEVALAKVKIPRISTLPIDEIMESKCLQSFKSSLDILLKADDRKGTQLANIEQVLGKLALMESKYLTAYEITDEVNEAHKRKIELEQEVQSYTQNISEAQKEESEVLNQINGKRLMIDDLKKHLAEEEADLRELEQLHSTQTTKLSEFVSGSEKVQDTLYNHCFNEDMWVTEASQGREGFLTVEATRIQMQQLLLLICSLKEEEAATP